MTRSGAGPIAAALTLALLVLGGAAQPEAEPTRSERAWHHGGGVALGLYPRAAERFGLAWPPPVEELAALGARTAWLPVSWAQHGLRGDTLAPDEETIDDEDLLDVASRAQAAGLEIVICPLIEVRGGEPGAWRGRIDPRAGLAWWRSYERFVLHYARLAERAGAQALVVTHELSGLARPGMEGHWRALAARVRRVFGGRLIAVVNHDALDGALPWSAFDHVGVSAYFPLADDPDASQDEIDRGWARAAERLRAFSTRIGRSVLLAEVGYPSLDGAAIEPWDHTPGAPVDLEEQRRCYAALERALPRMEYVEGAIFWAWLGPGGPHDRWYTPRGKPAEAIVRRLLASRGAAVRPERVSE